MAPEKKEKVLVLGTNSWAEVLVDLFEKTRNLEFVGFVENMDPTQCGKLLLERPIYSSNFIIKFVDTHLLTCSLATTFRSNWIEEMEGAGFNFIDLCHPSSVVSGRTDIGKGVIIDASCTIAGFTIVQNHTRIGRQCSIGHHTNIGEFCTIHPGSIISGKCMVGARTIIGTGAVVIDHITIGEGAVIAAGAVVTKDVPAGALFAGNPGRVVKTNYGPK